MFRRGSRWGARCWRPRSTDEARKELELVLKSAPENLAAIRGLAEIHERHANLPELDTVHSMPVAPRGAACDLRDSSGSGSNGSRRPRDTRRRAAHRGHAGGRSRSGSRGRADPGSNGCRRAARSCGCTPRAAPGRHQVGAGLVRHFPLIVMAVLPRLERVTHVRRGGVARRPRRHPSPQRSVSDRIHRYRRNARPAAGALRAAGGLSVPDGGSGSRRVPGARRRGDRKSPTKLRRRDCGRSAKGIVQTNWY